MEIHYSGMIQDHDYNTLLMMYTSVGLGDAEFVTCDYCMS